jgi:long-chain acyl-CoA synthetase
MSETRPAMPHASLLEYFQTTTRPAREPALVWREGYRHRRWSYGELLSAATRFSAELAWRGIGKGDRVLLWAGNSGPWVAAFLACMFRGAIAVPLDAVGEASFSRRVAQQAGVKLAIVARGLPSDGLANGVIALDDVARIAQRRAGARVLELVDAGRDDPVEIVFTSGTTAAPRGVVLTHGNILANLAPIEREFANYRRYERFVHPLRFLDLLPLSHVFGQFMGIFLPQVFGATVVFTDTLNPAEVVRQIHGERVSVLITVPRLLESLQGHVERDLAARGKSARFERDFQGGAKEHFLRRWWRFRAIRRQFGWRFLAMVSGGAALPAAAETFWTRLGYAVIQGYGLTETTSLVSVNHPFRLGRGSIGKTLPGLEMKLSGDGEILVRGENIASGYWMQSGVAPATDAEGWFHTGDLGARDEAGNLYFRGRSKNVIVTPEGLKVYPADLEAELRKEPGVRDCVVVSIERDGNAEACAVLLLRDGSSPAAAVRAANQRLAPFQQMRRWTVWPDSDFPRTPTQKPLLGEIARAAEAELRGQGGPGNTIENLLWRISGTGGAGANAGGKEPLQLSSVERVELLGELEDRYQVDLSEADFSSAETAASVRRLLDSPPPRAQRFRYPRWPLGWAARTFRAMLLACIARPVTFLLGRPTIRGREKAASASGPMLIIANHVTYLDPALVLFALPSRIRRRVAVAMDGERLEGMRNPAAGTSLFAVLPGRLQYYLLVSVFNVFPLPRQTGFQHSFAFAGELIDRGWSVLIFPEGELTRDGEIHRFRAGIGLLAARLRVPVLPLYLGGIWELKNSGKHRARAGQIKVSFGEVCTFSADERPEQIARQLEDTVRSLARNSP